MSYILNGKTRSLIYYNGERRVVKGGVATETPEALTAPTISLDGDILTISGSQQDNPVEKLVIFVDGVETATVGA